MVLGVAGVYLDNGAPIVQWDWHGGNNQLWQIVISSARPGPKPVGAAHSMTNLNRSRETILMSIAEWK